MYWILADFANKAGNFKANYLCGSIRSQTIFSWVVCLHTHLLRWGPFAAVWKPHIRVSWLYYYQSIGIAHRGTRGFSCGPWLSHNNGPQRSRRKLSIWGWLWSLLLTTMVYFLWGDSQITFKIFLMKCPVCSLIARKIKIQADMHMFCIDGGWTLRIISGGPRSDTAWLSSPI